MSAEGPCLRVSRAKDGSTWRIGTDSDVAWIANGTSGSRAITAAIPPVFDAYATIVLPDNAEEQEKLDRAVSGLLSEQSPDQPWWLGYLDTGADDVVFPDAPMVTLYSGWHYVLVEAGPKQAATWRSIGEGSFWKGVLPNLMFPADRSWLISTLWDDDWSCHRRIGRAGGQVPASPRSTGEARQPSTRTPHPQVIRRFNGAA